MTKAAKKEKPVTLYVTVLRPNGVRGEGIILRCEKSPGRPYLHGNGRVVNRISWKRRRSGRRPETNKHLP